jgi:hypothetical protein
MKTPIINRIGVLLLASFAIIACDDETFEASNVGKRITVEFETPAKEIQEDGGEQTIILKLDKPAFSDVMLTLIPAGSFGELLTTDPEIEDGLIKLAIAKGKASASIRLIPVNNALPDGDRSLEFSLGNLPPQFNAGGSKTISITLKDDDGGAAQSRVNFVSQDIALEETDNAGADYQVHLSEPASLDSEIGITLSSENGIYGQHFVTVPEAQNNVVKLSVSAGENLATFTVKPLDNNEVTGELSVQLTISETSGPLAKGNNLQQTLSIKDDELAGKPKGYEVTAGGRVIKKSYEYNAQGLIAKVKWENHTPFISHGTDTYHYDATGHLLKVTKSPVKEIVYHWSNDRIIRSDEVVDGEVQDYIEYEYDEAGKVGLVAEYHKQNDGNYQKGFFTVYLYFLDGNLFKSLTYQETVNPEEPHLVSTKTYENYIGVYNPFSMSEILPTVKTQTKLASTYRVEESGSGLDATYHMVYEYTAEGLPEKRTATATGDVQTAVYYYY